MEIYGKEIKFFRSVGATCEIAEICPDKDINKMMDLFNKDYPSKVLLMATTVSAMNKGYEMHEAIEAKHRGESYKATWLSVEECESLDSDTLMELFTEAIDSVNGGGKQSVKAKPKAGKKTEAESESD